MITVFLVEDNKDIQSLLKQLLTIEPDFLLLGIASNCNEALTTIPDCQPDVVIMDVGLPDGSGIDNIRQLKPQCPKTEFIVFTISEEDEVVFDALKAGANSYLLKTTPPKELLNAIAEVHHGGSSISSDIARKVISFFTTIDNAKKEKINQNEALLTKREIEMLENLALGLTYQETADKMFISLSTLKSHIYNTYEKLQVNNKVEAINKFFKSNPSPKKSN
ncbi:MAG: response regulator [Niabella sp.]